MTPLPEGGNNARVMRRLTVAGLCVALQVGALCAPLVHAHLDDHHGGHHEAPAVHAHVGGHPQGPAEAGHHVHGYVASGLSRTRDQPAIESQGGSEQTTRLQVFVAVASGVFAVPALPPTRFTLPPAFESVMRRLPDVVRSHGPPDLGPAASRAPPAPLV